MCNSRVTAIVFMAALAVASGLEAATITEWNLSGAAGTQATTAASNNAPGVTGSALTRGAGLSGNAGANSMNTTGWDTAPNADPELDTDNLEFGFDVAAGQQVLLDDLYIGLRSSGTGPGTIGLFTNQDSYTTPLYSLASPGDGSFLNTILDLSALSPITGSFRARLVEIGNSDASPPGTTASTGTFRVTAYFVAGTFDRNMQLTGTVVPEPGCFALLLMGGAVAAMCVRRGK